ncbi:MAG: hypothetical protein ACI4EV_09495, partial [Lachnospiraceae bacterium]
TYFDVGGWQVSNILTENLFEYEPKGVPDIKIEDAEVTNVALTDDIYNCLVTFKKTASGSVADITETYNRKYVFNKGTGNWNMYSDYHDDEFISYDIKVKAKDGMYLPKWYADNNKRPPEKYDLKFYGNKATLTYYSYSTLNYEYTTSNRGEAVIEMVRVTSPYTFDKECIYYYKFVNNVNAVFIQIDEDNIYANIGRRGDSPTGYRGSQLVLK